MRRTLALIAVGSFLMPAPAAGAGFELREFSATAQGTAYAGAAANPSDPASLFYNPATLAGVNQYDASVSLSGLLLNSSATFVGTTAAGTPAGGFGDPHGFIADALLPAVALRYRIDDEWAVGVTFTTPFGEGTDYPPHWTGRYFAVSTDLVAYNATPVVSWTPIPEFTFAAGAQVDYVRAFLSEAIDFGTIGAAAHIPGAIPGAFDGAATAHARAWGAGWIVGAFWQPTPAFSFGISYRSRIEHGLKGQETFTFDNGGIAATINHFTGAFTDAVGHASLPLPAQATFGGRWRFAAGLTALAEFEYTNWSAFRQLLFVSSNPANPPDLSVTNWKDTWFGSLGLEYRPDEEWTVRAGTAFDETAIPQVNVSPRIPDADRYWISAGVGYRMNGYSDLDFALSHLFAPHSTITQSVLQPGNAARGSLSGISNSSATLISLQLVVHG
jgi:long-chain fatty acid transport protein